MRHRKMTWVLVIWSAVMGLWLIGGIYGGAHDTPNCAGLDTQTCNDAADIGTGIGVGVIFGLWFAGFVVLSLIWFMSRPKEEK